MSIAPDPNSTVADVRVTAGVDWAKDDHAVCVVGDQGEVIDRFAVAHDAAGLKRMTSRLLRASVQSVGIERGDGPVVEALLAAGLTVFVIPPGQVKNLRSRYGSAGNKDDRFDAYVLADVVRTDARRLRPMVFDSEQTTALRSSVRIRRDLVAHRVAAANQLRAHLQIVFPAAATLFADIDSADHPVVPGALRHPGRRRLALAQTAGHLAAQRPLQRGHRPHRAARPDPGRTPRRHRSSTPPPTPPPQPPWSPSCAS